MYFNKLISGGNILRFKINKCILLTIILFICFSVYGQQTGSVKLLGLSVEGNKISEEEVVKMSSGLQEGSFITIEDIQASVQQLWNLGIFSDIKIIVNESPIETCYGKNDSNKDFHSLFHKKVPIQSNHLSFG